MFLLELILRIPGLNQYTAKIRELARLSAAGGVSQIVKEPGARSCGSNTGVNAVSLGAILIPMSVKNQTSRKYPSCLAMIVRVRGYQ